MKDPLNRTKVVLRHLPPSISESALRDQIDGRFSGRYKWFSFRPGKNSQKNRRQSRAYIDFQSPEDVIEFAEIFDGHTFVNEKGTQIRALVEYAPSQRVPRLWSKEDGREGTILKDPEYLEFLEFLAKPAENLPSAEIQLEKREAERSGVSKESPIVTPLMDFVRQKRAAKSGSQRSVNGRLSRRAGGGASSSSGSSSKRGSGKQRVSTSVYVLRDSTKGSSNGKDKSTYMLMPRKEGQNLSSPSADAPDDETGTTSNVNYGTTPIVSGSVEIGKKRLMLLKGKERETTHVSGGFSQQRSATSLKDFTGSTLFKQGQRHEASGKIIRTILSNNDARQSPSSAVQSEQQTQAVNLERDKRPPRPPNPRQILKDHIAVTANASFPDSDGRRPLDDLLGSVAISQKNERRTRNKDRPDRGVWTPLRRADGTRGGDDSSFCAHLSEGTYISQQVGGDKDNDGIASYSTDGGRGTNLLAPYDSPSSHGETKPETNTNRMTDVKILAGGRANISILENGSHRHIGRRGLAHGMKEVDGSVNFLEGKTCKRGGSTGYGSHEKQVWVQKSGSGS